MNDRQKRFIAEYVGDLNATQAAIRAGYSQKTANEQGARLLAKASIRQAIDSGRAIVKSRMQNCLRTGDEYQIYSRLESDENAAERRLREEETARLRRLELLNGLTRRQRHFLLEKLCGHSDKDAALLAGYSLSVAENTKQRVWKPVVRSEFERLSENLTIQFSAKGLPNLGMVGKC